jgi:diguanylate cyclase (GGDEF)-like protein/PAS domain S-box-containing protein
MDPHDLHAHLPASETVPNPIAIAPDERRCCVRCTTVGADPHFLERVLDLSPGIVFAADRNLDLTYVNQAALDLLGYGPDEVVGRSVLDFLDTNWNPEAFASIATALSSEGGRRPPMTFRVITKDGRRPIIEATANVQLDDPVINGFVVYVRPWTERWLLDRAFESVAAGDPIRRTMDLLVEVAGADTMEADAAIVFDPAGDTFHEVVASGSLAPALQGPTSALDATARGAWTALLRSGTSLVVNVDGLPEPLRALAAPSGYRSLWVAPGDRDARGGAGVWAIAWRRELHLDADETRTAMMHRLATLAGLALARTRNEERNAYAATHDAMTGLWNRNAVFEWLATALGADDEAGGVGVVYVDLDRFKPVNDAFGHAAGDRVLREVAHRLVEVAPAACRVGRFGGDEFVVVGPAADRDELERLADRLVAALEAPNELRTGESVQVGASAGSAFTRPGGASADELVESADAALYRVKGSRSGRSS